MSGFQRGREWFFRHWDIKSLRGYALCRISLKPKSGVTKISRPVRVLLKNIKVNRSRVETGQIFERIFIGFEYFLFNIPD
jgi:hypothetical protein